MADKGHAGTNGRVSPFPTSLLAGRGQWLLVRWSVSDPTERAYFRVAGSVDTPVSEMVRVAGRRCAIELEFEQVKGVVVHE